MTNTPRHPLMDARLIVEMPDGSRWSVPVALVAADRARAYMHEFDNNFQQSLSEDTLPLFESDDYEIHDWAANNMNWSEVAHAAFRVDAPPAVDYQEGWCNGEWRVVKMEAANA